MSLILFAVLATSDCCIVIRNKHLNIAAFQNYLTEQRMIVQCLLCLSAAITKGLNVSSLPCYSSHTFPAGPVGKREVFLPSLTFSQDSRKELVINKLIYISLSKNSVVCDSDFC